MSFDDLNPTLPKTSPPMLPWWTYLVPFLVLVGVVVTLFVMARQTDHMATTKSTNESILVLKTDIATLKGYISDLEARADKASDDIESISSETSAQSDDRQSANNDEERKP